MNNQMWYTICLKYVIYASVQWIRNKSNYRSVGVYRKSASMCENLYLQDDVETCSVLGNDYIPKL